MKLTGSYVRPVLTLASLVCLAFASATSHGSTGANDPTDDNQHRQQHHQHQQQQHLQQPRQQQHPHHRQPTPSAMPEVAPFPPADHQQQHHHQQQQPEQRHRRRRHRRQPKDPHHHLQDNGECAKVAAHFADRVAAIRTRTGGILNILDEKITVSNQSICHTSNNNNNNNHQQHHSKHLQQTCCSLEDEVKLENLAVLELEDMVAGELENLKNAVQELVTFNEERLSHLQDKLSSQLRRVLTGDFRLPGRHVNSSVGHLEEHLDLYLTDVPDVDLSRLIDHFFDSIFALSYYYILHKPIGAAEPEAGHSACVVAVKNAFPGRSFVSAKLRSSLGFVRTSRTMVSSLKEIVQLTSSLEVDKSCSRRVTQLNYCSKCTGVTSLPPCQASCLKVMTGCLANYMDLDFQWRDFIEVLSQLVALTKDHESVVESFHFKVEEALIHYHIEAELMYNTVTSQCGAPDAGRWTKKNFVHLMEKGRRMIEGVNSSHAASGPEELDSDHAAGRNRRQTSKEEEEEEEEEKSASSNQVVDFVRQLENLWPFQNIGEFCGRFPPPLEASAAASNECWNGSSISQHSKLSYLNDVPGVVVGRISNAAHIAELLENNSMIIFKKTMGSSLPILGKQYESSGDYGDFLSGSGMGDEDWDDFSGSGYYYYGTIDGNETETTDLQPSTQAGDFDFTDSTIQSYSPSSSSSLPSSSPSSPSFIPSSPKSPAKPTITTARPSKASVSAARCPALLLLTSAVLLSTVMASNCHRTFASLLLGS